MLAVEALLATVTPPLTAPADFGANSTVSVALCPGVSVTAPPIPVSLSPVPLILSLEIAMLELPVFLREISRVAELPKFTLPNAMLAGLTLNVRELAVPVPDTATDTLLSVPVDFTTIDPLTLPAASGRNATMKRVWAPPSIDIGVLIPDIENPFALVVTLSTHIVAAPMFFMKTISVSWVPTGTSPNAVLSGVIVAYA